MVSMNPDQVQSFIDCLGSVGDKKGHTIQQGDNGKFQVVTSDKSPDKNFQDIKHLAITYLGLLDPSKSQKVEGGGGDGGAHHIAKVNEQEEKISAEQKTGLLQSLGKAVSVYVDRMEQFHPEESSLAAHLQDLRATFKIDSKAGASAAAAAVSVSEGKDSKSIKIEQLAEEMVNKAKDMVDRDKGKATETVRTILNILITKDPKKLHDAADDFLYNPPEEAAYGDYKGIHDHEDLIDHIEDNLAEMSNLNVVSQRLELWTEICNLWTEESGKLFEKFAEQVCDTKEEKEVLKKALKELSPVPPRQEDENYNLLVNKLMNWAK